MTLMPAFPCHRQLAGQCLAPQPIFIGRASFIEFLLFPTFCPGSNQPIQTVSGSPLGDFTMGPTFQIITWSLFGVLLIAYIGVKMSKRRKQS
jgi:hypothetical protein